MLHVEDSGAGISKEDVPKLFTRFGKLQRTAKMNADGVGLGLTIVKEVVEKHNGKIEVISEGPGQGTIFIISMEMAFVDEVESEQDSLEEELLRLHEPSTPRASMNVMNAPTESADNAS